MTFVDRAGILGAAASRPTPKVLAAHGLRQKYIRPSIETVSGLLTKAEAYGDAVFDLYLITAREVFLDGGNGSWQQHRLPNVVHCGSAVATVPADEDDRADLAKLWEREVARGTGIAMWEDPPAGR